MKMMLKKLVPGVLLFALLGGAAYAQTRVATVDLQKTFDKYWKTEQAVAGLKDRAAEFDKTHKEMADNWKKMKEDYQKLVEEANNQAVSSEERDKRKQAAEDKLKDIKDLEDNITKFERQAGATISEQKARLRKNILEEIKQAINGRAKAGGYSLVIDTGAQTYVADPGGPYYTPTILYNNDENDITQAVIAQLNASAPVEAPPVDEKKPEPKNGKK